jgi:hypothetical protein
MWLLMAPIEALFFIIIFIPLPTICPIKYLTTIESLALIPINLIHFIKINYFFQLSFLF